MYYFLIGFMGAGKTTFGAQLAQQQGWEFIDLDAYIEKISQISVNQLFAEKGEAIFRQIEADALRMLVNSHSFPPLAAALPCLIACGGGTPLYFDNHAFMKSVGKTIYLKISPEILAERLNKDKEKRPLLQNMTEAELLAFIQQKLQAREEEYEKADVILLA